MDDEREKSERPATDKRSDIVAAGDESQESAAQGKPRPPEEFAQMPPAVRRMFTQQVEQMMMVASGPAQNPVLAKVTPEHISKVIENAEAESKRQHESEEKDRAHSRTIYVATLVFVLILVLGVLALKPDLLEKVLSLLAAVLGGIGVKAIIDKRRG